MCEIQVTSGNWYEIRLSLKPVAFVDTLHNAHYTFYAHTINIFRLMNRHNEAHPYSEDFKLWFAFLLVPSLTEVRDTLSSLQSSSLKNG